MVMKRINLVMKYISLLALVGLLAACDVATHPVAVVGPGNTIYRGTATATLLEGGWFQVSNGTNTCQGRYQPGTIGATVTFPVRCTNGLAGIGTATYQSALQGGGEIVMQDGTRWQFIFGRSALAL